MAWNIRVQIFTTSFALRWMKVIVKNEQVVKKWSPSSPLGWIVGSFAIFFGINLEITQKNLETPLRPEVLRPRPRSQTWFIQFINVVYLFRLLSGEGSHLSATVDLLTVQHTLITRYFEEFHSKDFWQNFLLMSLRGELFIWNDGGSTLLRMAPSNFMEWAFSFCICVGFLQVQQYLNINNNSI